MIVTIKFTPFPQALYVLKIATISWVYQELRVRSFGVIRIRISDPRSLGSWCIKETDESTLVTNSSIPLMRHDPSDLGSLILTQITPKERTLSSQRCTAFIKTRVEK